MRRSAIVITALLAMTAVANAPASAAIVPVTTYNATVQPLPGNLPSEGAEAYSFNEFGDEVKLDSSSTARHLATVTVTMSSWACEQGTWFNKDCVTTRGDKFTVPITLNIYNEASANNDGTVTPGSLITSATKTFSIPYRPTANLNKCNGTDLGKWWSKADSKCYNGKAANITWRFTSLGLTVPDTMVIGIAYNTSHYGYHPIGQSPACYSTEAGCPYDSLNIGLGPAVTVGSKPYPDTVFQNAAYASDYCDSSPAVGVFNLDSPTTACWSGFVPAIRVRTY
jgi:hypothetical protein